MKTIAFLLITFLINSCHKQEDEVAITPNNDNYVRAKIDDVPYEAIGIALHGSLDENGFDLDSRNASSTGMDFNIIGSINVGTYTFSSSNVSTQGRLNYRINGENYSSGFCGASNGTLTITAKNGKTVEGTFSFNPSSMSEPCLNPKMISVTEGSFKITVL